MEQVPALSAGDARLSTRSGLKWIARTLTWSSVVYAGYPEQWLRILGSASKRCTSRTSAAIRAASIRSWTFLAGDVGLAGGDAGV